MLTEWLLRRPLGNDKTVFSPVLPFICSLKGLETTCIAFFYHVILTEWLREGRRQSMDKNVKISFLTVMHPNILVTLCWLSGFFVMLSAWHQKGPAIWITTYYPSLSLICSDKSTQEDPGANITTYYLFPCTQSLLRGPWVSQEGA